MSSMGLRLGFKPFKRRAAAAAVFGFAESLSENKGSNFATTHVITLGLTPAAGDLMILALSGTDTNSFSSVPSGWTLLLSANILHIYYKIAAGTELPTDNLSFTSNNATRLSVVKYRFTGAGVPTGTITQFSLDVPAHPPAGGSADTFWLALVGWTWSAGMGSTDPSCTAGPSGWGLDFETTQVFPAAASGSRGGCSGALRRATLASTDPASFTHVATPAYYSVANVAIRAA